MLRLALTAPRRYYMCNRMQGMRLRCREKPYIRAEQLEEPIWSEVKRVLQNPDLIVAGIATLDSQEGGGMEEEIAQAERDLRSIQMEEDHSRLGKNGLALQVDQRSRVLGRGHEAPGKPNQIIQNQELSC